jgi:hypothetical protein
MDGYDPGDLNDDSRRRRKRRGQLPENELDDQWAAANDEADHHAGLEDLASEYVYEPMSLDGTAEPVEHDNDSIVEDEVDLGPLPPSARRLSQRPIGPRQERVKKRFDRSRAYADSPSYHRDAQNPLERLLSLFGGESLLSGPESDSPKLKRGMEDLPVSSSHIPFWGILVVVILALAAVMVTVLACVSVVLILRG